MKVREDFTITEKAPTWGALNQAGAFSLIVKSLGTFVWVSTAYLLLHPVQEVPPLPPESVQRAPGVDVALPRHLEPGQVCVLLTHSAAQGFLSGDRHN